MAQNDKGVTPPYVAFRTFLNFLDWLHDAGVPTRIDRSFWGERLSGAYGFQLMAALHFLDLIDDDNKTQPELETMALDVDKRKPILRERLEESYADALSSINLEKATHGELEDRFRIYHIEGETLRKAVVFFIHAASYSGIPLSTHITKKTRGMRGSGAKKRGHPSKRKPLAEQQDKPASELPRRHDLHESINGLLADLARIGPSWTKEERERWVNTFIANVDYAYPIKAQEASGNTKQ
ncbi:MAG TPA: hypothetical protein VEG28_02360 [Dehalococcoidia bacterium]|nr:hypothetical protein [Dehalococcoidia bacterium]